MYAPRHLQDLVGPEMQLRQHVLPTLDDRREARVVDHDRIQPLHIERALPRGGHGEEVRLLLLTLEERAEHANGLAAVIVRRVDARRTHADVLRCLLHALAGRDEDRHAALLLVHTLEELVVEKLPDILAHDLDLCRLLGIEGIDLEHIRALEVLAIERRIDRRGQPDEPASNALAEGEAELELSRGLMDLVHDQRVARQDVTVLEPAARDPRGHDDDVPAWRVGRCFALSVDDPNPQRRRTEQLLGDRTNGERLSGTCAGDDAEALPRARQLANPWAEILLEVRLDVEAHGELDGLARRSCGRDHDDAPRRGLRADERFAVGR